MYKYTLKIRHQTLNVQIVIDKEDIKFSKSHRKQISRVKTNRHSHSSMENNLSSTHFLPVCCYYLAAVRPGDPLSCLHARLNEIKADLRVTVSSKRVLVFIKKLNAATEPSDLFFLLQLVTISFFVSFPSRRFSPFPVLLIH